MFDFRLKVFYTVARRLSFTRSAEELFITQPAVTKHIRELERYFKVKLFDRQGNKILLSLAGEKLLQYTEKLFVLYRDMEFAMSDLTSQHSGSLRIGTSSTLGQYVIPEILADFKKQFKEVHVSLVNGNTEYIEKLLLSQEIDLGIIEGHSKNKEIQYAEFLRDEIVLVSNATHPLTRKEFLKPEELKSIPLLLRESGSGTLQVIAHAFKKIGLRLSDLQVEMQLNNTESIKSYLLHSQCMAFVSIYSVLDEIQQNRIKIIDVKGLSIERPFYFIQQQGQVASLPELFTRFARSVKG